MGVSQSRALLLEMLRDLPRPFTLSRDKGTIFLEDKKDPVASGS